jgi:hypothetical protein
MAHSNRTLVEQVLQSANPLVNIAWKPLSLTAPDEQLERQNTYRVPFNTPIHFGFRPTRSERPMPFLSRWPAVVRSCS